MSLVNWAEGNTRHGETVHAGQTITSWRALAEHSAFTDDYGKHVTPTIGKCRRAADYLKKAREVTWKPTGTTAGRGILITLERWAFYNGTAGEAADHPAGQAAHPSAGYPAPIEERYRASPRRSIQVDNSEWERLEREGLEEVARELRVQKGSGERAQEGRGTIEADHKRQERVH